jgi:hypothetical protein
MGLLTYKGCYDDELVCAVLSESSFQSSTIYLYSKFVRPVNMKCQTEEVLKMGAACETVHHYTENCIKELL